MISNRLRLAIERSITTYEHSRLARLTSETGNYVIKFVPSRWAAKYEKRASLKISDAPALTWGTATYVTPLAFPLSSALYGRAGLVTEFDPTGWRVFDATDPVARIAYVNWVQVQPSFSELVLTVHSTHANHFLRNRFRERFNIDCVLFNPDQEADLHTDRGNHVWMAVTDWSRPGKIDTGMSTRLSKARFTVLIDEDFALEETTGLPIQKAERQIERVTEKISLQQCAEVGGARLDPTLPNEVVRQYIKGGYLHVYIKP